MAWDGSRSGASGYPALVAKLLYKPLSLAVSALGGVLAGVAFGQVWMLVGGDADAPKATDRDRGWTEVLAAATVQGAVFGLVKAAMDRAGAAGFARATGRWPGK